MSIELIGGRGWDCNQFLVKDQKSNGFDLVDAGHGMDFEAVLSEVRQIMDPARIRRVVITHEHLDHVNGLPHWQNLGARIVTSPTVANKLAEGRDPTSEAFGMRIPVLAVDDIVADGDRVQLGSELYEVLATPGHSPGSTCYWHDDSGVLFAGDVLFAQGGIGRFDFPDSSLQHHYESILRLGKLPIKVLHSGHGPSSTGEDATNSVRGSVAHVTSCMPHE